MKYVLKISLSFLFLFQVCYSFAQVWPKYYGQTNTYNFSDDIIEQYDNGILICGNIYNVGNETTQQSWLIKTDINGDTLWGKIIVGGDDFIRTTAIEQTKDGGILLCGLIWTEIGGSDPYVMKLNECGEKEWCKIFVGSVNNNTGAQDIKEMLSNEIILLVNQYGENNIEDMFLFKLSPDGEILWKNPYCSGYIHPEAFFPFGNKVITTESKGYIISGKVYWEDPWNPGGPLGLRPLFVSIDSLGNENWVLPFGVQDTIYGDAFEAIELDNGSFVGAANQWPESGRLGLFIHFDAEGNILNYNIIDFINIDTLYKDGIFINLKKGDSLYFAGCGLGDLNQGLKGGEIVFDNDIFNPNFIAYYNRYDENANYPYTLERTTSNKLLSNSTFKETGNWDIALSKLNLNLEYDTLDPGNYTYDSLCTTPGLPQSGFIYLDDYELITGIDVPSPEQYYAHLKTIPLSVYPNPANKIVNFAMENTGHHKNIALKCFDLMGKKVFESPVITGQKETSAVISHWPNGMYVAVVYSEGLPVGECKFVVE